MDDIESNYNDKLNDLKSNYNEKIEQFNYDFDDNIKKLKNFFEDQNKAKKIADLIEADLIKYTQEVEKQIKNFKI